MKTILLLFALCFLVQQEEKVLWKTEIKTLTNGKESIVLSGTTQSCNVGRAYETLISTTGDTIYNTYYGISMNKKLIYFIHILHNKSSKDITVAMKKNEPGLLDDTSGEYVLTEGDFMGLKYEKAGVVNTLIGGETKELVLTYFSKKKEHINCSQIMTFNKDEGRLHYKIVN